MSESWVGQHGVAGSGGLLLLQGADVLRVMAVMPLAITVSNTSA